MATAPEEAHNRHDQKGPPMQQYASVEKLGPTQSRLASGALLIRDVPIARAGTQSYHASEIAGALNGDTAIDDAGMVEVVRRPEDVFDPQSMASFEGVSVVMQHPDDFVAPNNWSDLAIGHAQNIRRDGDLLIADLLIHDARAIDAIRNHGWRAVSCGYDANYLPLRDGRLRQVDITGNHIALLPPVEQARCGPLCAVGDQAWIYGGYTMHIRDQQGAFREGREEIRWDQREVARPEWTQGGLRPGGAVGPRRILKLDGPASAYQIISSADGETWLCFSGKIDGSMDPGRVHTGDNTRHFLRVAQDRARREQAASAAMAQGVSDFWKKQQSHA
jgi:hypothetical protein